MRVAFLSPLRLNILSVLHPVFAASGHPVTPSTPLRNRSNPAHDPILSYLQLSGSVYAINSDAPQPIHQECGISDVSMCLCVRPSDTYVVVGTVAFGLNVRFLGPT